MCVFVLCVIASAVSAAAQTSVSQSPPDKTSTFKASWEVTVSGGPGWSRGGGFLAFETAQPTIEIPTNSGKLLSSWFLNSLGSFTLLTPVARPFVPLNSLYTVVSGPQIAHPQRGAFGVRATRWGSPHTGIEVAFNGVVGAPNRLGGADIEASRASFESAFNAIFAASPQLYGSPVVTATTVTTGHGAEFDTTADLIVTKAAGRFRPYATAGGGYRLEISTAETAQVTGRYTFTTPTGAPIDETDAVTIHYANGSTGLMAFGGGIRVLMKAHAGLRVDARGTFGKDRDTVSVDATPTSVAGTPAGFVVQPATRTVPRLVFSNTPAQRTTLSGPPIVGLPTARGTGWRQTWMVTAGWFWAF